MSRRSTTAPTPHASRALAVAAAAAVVIAVGTGSAVRPLAAQIPQSEYAERRAALAKALDDDGIVLALGAPEPAENYLAFNQAPRFLYLTGFREPDAALVLVRHGKSVTTTLFVQPRDPAHEVWTGSRVGVEGAPALTGLPARPWADLPRVLDSLIGKGLPLGVVANLSEGGEQPAAEEKAVAALAPRLRGTAPDLAPTGVVDRLRGTKSAAELALIRKAVAITMDAQREAIAAVRPGMNEFELQALIEYTFRRNGADRPSFATIVGSGPNATTLHYNADDRFTQPGDMIVMDIGASYRGYAADVTRTVPASGRFTPEQREVYQLVRDAQAAAERTARLGVTKRALGDAAASVLAAGLARLGLVESPTATYDCGAAPRPEAQRCPQYRLYYMHGLGHGIGLDVHDPDQYDTGAIAPGSAFTIEPGVYVRANLLDIIPDTPRNRALVAKIRPSVERYRNIGVRIEDDYVATADGIEWVSRAPRELAEVESLLAQPRTEGVAKRDEAKVEWYRETGSK